jgi:hypothetical protein
LMSILLEIEEFRTWLIAVALFERNLCSASDVVQKSLSLLPLAPDSRSLLPLADPSDSRVYRQDILTAIDTFLDDAVLPRPGHLDWAWIALWSTFLPTNSIADDLSQNRFRFDLQTEFSALFEYTLPFIAAQDDVADGVDPGAVARSIREQVDKVRPQFLLDFEARFEAAPQAWILGALR